MGRRSTVEEALGLLPGERVLALLRHDIWKSVRAPGNVTPVPKTVDTQTVSGLEDELTGAEFAAALAGDDVAFAALYRHVQPRLLRYVSVLTTDVDDVCSETWMQACRDLHRFKGDLPAFRGWIARIARNRAIDHARAQRRRPTDPLPDEGGSLVDEEVSGEESTLESLSTEHAMNAIRALPPDQAQAVLLRAILGLDAKTAARVLGKRPGAVRTAAYRGLRTLASSFTPLIDDGPAEE